MTICVVPSALLTTHSLSTISHYTHNQPTQGPVFPGLPSTAPGFSFTPLLSTGSVAYPNLLESPKSHDPSRLFPILSPQPRSSYTTSPHPGPMLTLCGVTWGVLVSCADSFFTNQSTPNSSLPITPKPIFHEPIILISTSSSPNPIITTTITTIITTIERQSHSTYLSPNISNINSRLFRNNNNNNNNKSTTIPPRLSNANIPRTNKHQI